MHARYKIYVKEAEAWHCLNKIKLNIYIYLGVSNLAFEEAQPVVV